MQGATLLFGHNPASARPPVRAASDLPPSVVLAGLVPFAWLFPGHYLPWLAARHEFVALALASLAAMLCRSCSRLPHTWAVAIAVAVLSVGLQAFTGRITFGGDAVMVILYLGAFTSAICVGHSLAEMRNQGSWPAVDMLALGTAVAATASVALALMQWTDIYPFAVPVAALASGDRPYANFSQANNFATACFMGLCALAWLFDGRRIGRTIWYTFAALLLLGMALSGSRTAWLQATLLVPVLLLRRSELRVRLHVAVALAAFVLLSLAWPAINETALLSAPRGSIDQARTDLRVPLWIALIDAVGREPWWGWGWQQVAKAQLAVALDHIPLQRYFEHSHNLVLDLLLWAGVPIGGTITLLVGVALFRQARAVLDQRALWLLAGVLGLFVHAMLEFPLEYAYFLIPLGLTIGLLHGQAPGEASFAVPRWLLRTIGALLAVALTVITADYLQAEHSYRTVRLESRFGTRKIESLTPDLKVLTHLRAYLDFIRTEAAPGMAPARLASMRAVGSRFVHPPVLLRLALAEGLNNEPNAARDALLRLCAIHLPDRCSEGRESWLALQATYPQLADIPPPRVPAAR